MEFGLIGKSLTHSFSKSYFSEKFLKENLSHTYSNFELESIDDFPKLINQNKKLKGLNVTIPYKEQLIPYLDELDEEAKKIGAINTIAFNDGKLIGFNTDVWGFEQSLLPRIKSHHKKALILGSGGAQKAIVYVLKKLRIQFKVVSRIPSMDRISYDEGESLISDHLLIINTTPLGTFPHVDQKPPLSLNKIGSTHLAYDLIYNPPETAFLAEAKMHGADIINGLEMLQLQANKSWMIWNEF